MGWNQNGTPLINAKQRKEASGKSVSQIQASSDGNTHKSKHKLRGGGGEQPEQKQGIRRMPKTRVHSTLCKVPARSHPTLTTQELQFYSGSYPPNCWRGIFTLVPNTKRDTELAKRALLAEKREKHLGR